MTAQNSLEHLQLLLERVVYLLRRVVTEPSIFMGGRHHQDAQDAINAFETRVNANGGWKLLLNQGGMNSAHHESVLKAHGLTEAEFSLKYHAFTQQFERFLDRMAALDWRTQVLETKLELIERQSFAKTVRGTRKAARDALDIAEPIVGSAAEAIPFAKETLSALKELTSVFQGLIQAKH
jgi:hypothetical protein